TIERAPACRNAQLKPISLAAPIFQDLAKDPVLQAKAASTRSAFAPTRPSTKSDSHERTAKYLCESRPEGRAPNDAFPERRGRKAAVDPGRHEEGLSGAVHSGGEGVVVTDESATAVRSRNASPVDAVLRTAVTQWLVRPRLACVERTRSPHFVEFVFRIVA